MLKYQTNGASLVMGFLLRMPVLNIWLGLPRGNKVEILTPFQYTKRFNLEGSRSSGDGDYGGGYGDGARRFGRRRFSGPRPFRLSPVLVGEEYDVKIESLSKRGDSGVARVQGLVVFVAGTNVGDNVKIRITRVGPGYATAEVAGQTATATAAGGASPGAPLVEPEDSGDINSGV